MSDGSASTYEDTNDVSNTMQDQNPKSAPYFGMMRRHLVPSFRFNWADGSTFSICAFQEGPSHLAQLRITFKSCTDGFPRRTGSSVLFHRSELSIVWCRPGSIQNWCGASWKYRRWFSGVFRMVGCWSGLMRIRSQSHC